jgi:hypothetical protein
VVVLVLGLLAFTSMSSRIAGLERELDSMRVQVTVLQDQLSQVNAEVDGLRNPQPSLAALPSSGLHDGTPVSVALSGFTPGVNVSLLECLASAQNQGLGGCDSSGLVPVVADQNGEVATTFVVRDHVITSTGARSSCRAVTCYLAAAADAGHYAYLPLAFAG